MTVTCPVHRRLVAATPAGRLLGVCDECARECADAIDKVVHGVAAAQFWATETLKKYRGAA